MIIRRYVTGFMIEGALHFGNNAAKSNLSLYIFPGRKGVVLSEMMLQTLNDSLAIYLVFEHRRRIVSFGDGAWGDKINLTEVMVFLV